MLLHLLSKFARDISDPSLFTGDSFPILAPVRRVTVFTHEIFLAKEKGQRKVPPSFESFALENRVNMSLLMPSPTFAAASDLVGFVASKRLCFSQTDRVCILPYCEAYVPSFVEP